MFQSHLRAGLGSPLEREEYRQHSPLPPLALSLSAQGQEQVRLEGPGGRRGWQSDQRGLLWLAAVLKAGRRREAFGDKMPAGIKAGVSLPLWDVGIGILVGLFILLV